MALKSNAVNNPVSACISSRPSQLEKSPDKDFTELSHTVNDNKTKPNGLLNKIKIHKKIVDIAFRALGFFIPLRRIQSAPEKLENKDYVSLAELLGIAIILLPEDLRDTNAGLKQVFKGELPDYDFKECQIPFSFIRGSNIEKPVNRLGGKVGYLIHQMDKPLSATKFGKKVRNFLKVEEIGREPTKRKVPQIIKNSVTGKFVEKRKEVKAIRIKGSFVGKLIYSALQRTTVYGSIALCAICLPSAINAFITPKHSKDKLINGVKQTVKSSISVVSLLSGIGLIGALMAPLGPAGSVAGMAIGAACGAYISNKINENIKTDN